MSTSSTLVLALVLLAVIGTAFFAYAGVLRALGYPGATLLWSMPLKILRRLRRPR